MSEATDVVVVGAGQAGLVVSYLLTQASIPHLVLERGAIGESWRSQRWDSFHLNTPNWSNGLAGMEFHPEEPHGFAHRDQLIGYLERYAATNGLPIRPHSNVTALEALSTGGYALQTKGGTIHSIAVVVAGGGLSRPRVPPIAMRLSPDIISLSAGTYRNPNTLPEGAVVVVGSAQSGCQIAEDLLDAGRHVYLCASRVARVPRMYRGRDIVAWMRDMRFLEDSVDELEDPSMQFAAQPQVSGTDGGHTVSLQLLARHGATLLGRVLDADGPLLRLDDSLQMCIDFADEKSQGFKTAIDNFIDQKGIRAEAAQPDPGEPAPPDLNDSNGIDTLDLRGAGVASVIWCTGYDADWSWIKVDVFDEQALPRHRAGVTRSPGLYFIGLPWLTKRKSGILYGVSEDAANIAHHVERYLQETQSA